MASRTAAALAAGTLALFGGAAMTGCGDDKEGAGEDAGERIDDAAGEAERELDDAAKDGKKD